MIIDCELLWSNNWKCYYWYQYNGDADIIKSKITLMVYLYMKSLWMHCICNKAD